MFGALLLMASVLTVTAAWPRTVLDLDVQKQPVALQDWGDYLIEENGSVPLQQVADSPDQSWTPTGRNTIYPMKAGKALWIRFTIPPAPDSERWYLEVPYPAIDRASLYTLDSAGKWTEQKAGDLVAVSSWPVPHRYPLLPVVASAEVQSRYLLRLENGHAFSAPLQFVSESHFNHSEQRVSLVLGIFFGLAGLAAIISALSALSLRDPAYGFYAISVALTALNQAAITGIGGLHLWSNWPWWNDVSIPVLSTLQNTFTLMFIAAAVSLPERSARLNFFIKCTVVLGIFVAAALSVTPLERRMDLFLLNVLVPQLLAAYVLVWAWRRGDRFAPLIMLALSPLALSYAYLTARNMGLVPISFLTQHGTQLGVAIELPLILVMLMLRSQQRRENSRRIQGLDQVDPATGLINNTVFCERMRRMIARSSRLQHQSAVILVDIVNAEQIERDFGRKAAEDLPLRVAERLLSTAREIDSTARLSGRRFGMLAEGPLSPEDAIMLCQRIVAQCLMPYKGLHLGCVGQVHVAYATVPRQGSNVQALLTRLEDRLAFASGQRKKAVFVLDEAALPRRARPSRETVPDMG